MAGVLFRGPAWECSRSCTHPSASLQSPEKVESIGDRWHSSIRSGRVPRGVSHWLVLFAYGLHWYIFADILLITLATLTLYIYSHILPVLHWECPYRTPLAFLLRKWARHVALQSEEVYSVSSNISLESYREIESTLVSLTHDGRSHAFDVIDLIHDGLRWLYQHASNPTAKDVVLESMAGLSSAPWSLENMQWMLDMLNTLQERLQYRVVLGDKQSLLDLERHIRAVTSIYNS
ncbi:hypothetical protein K525DRAFT_275596 [Schizophyllum commune Loenen D]|nr:hypothetical protein K525DRAFT_275596 [Schizophyllum commune Loenen D]